MYKFLDVIFKQWINSVCIVASDQFLSLSSSVHLVITLLFITSPRLCTRVRSASWSSLVCSASCNYFEHFLVVKCYFSRLLNIKCTVLSFFAHQKGVDVFFWSIFPMLLRSPINFHSERFLHVWVCKTTKNLILYLVFLCACSY